MFALDTNLLVYSLDTDAGPKQKEALQFVTLAGQSGAAVLTEQSLIEFLHAALRKRMRPLAEALDSVRKWAAVFRIIIPDATVVARTLFLIENHRLSVWDARLLATCASNGCNLLLTEDLQDGALYGTVRAVNPLNPANSEFLQGALAQ